MKPPLLLALLISLAAAASAQAQAECNGYGGLRGIRVDGQLFPFATSLRATRAGDGATATTANERTRNPTYAHNGNTQTCTGGLAFPAGDGSFAFADRRTPPAISFTETFTDTGPGAVKVEIHITANDAFDGQVDLLVDPPAPPGPAAAKFEIDTTLPKTNSGSQTVITLVGRSLGKAEQSQATVTFRVTGNIDHSPATLSLDSSHTLSPFLGIGGNFRLQNPTADPAIIRYNLDHLSVAWSRIAMPLNLWQPDEAAPPPSPEAAQLQPAVRAAMEMGQRLAQRGVPIIISVWSAPPWALAENPPPASSPATRSAATMADAPNRGNPRPPRRLRGRAIRPDKLQSLCRSIVAYLLYAKTHFDFEPALFSFNESDLGIDIRQTPAEHDQLIRTLGPMLQSAGFKTKLLLGDTSDCTPTHFIDPAMSDPQATPYIGAVSFHSWRGGGDAQLAPWGQAARKLNVPLLVAEGGTDAAAWAYPAIMREPWFALDEIGLYVRICALDHPASILEWQLTSDYAVLAGGRDGQPLSPTMRFWQLQQLDLTPPGAPAVPVRCDCPVLQCCAYAGDAGACAIHIVNAGPQREASIVSLPAAVRQLRVRVTNASGGMLDRGALPVNNGVARFTCEPMSFTTLVSQP